MNGLKSASWKQQFFSLLPVWIIKFGVTAPAPLLRMMLKYQLCYGNTTPTKLTHLLTIATCQGWDETHPGEVPIFSVWIIWVNIRTVLYMQDNLLTRVSRCIRAFLQNKKHWCRRLQLFLAWFLYNLQCLTFGFLQFILPTVALASNKLLLLHASPERS